jgi:hypothetical protein
MNVHQLLAGGLAETDSSVISLQGAADCRSKCQTKPPSGQMWGHKPGFAFPSLVNCLYWCNASTRRPHRHSMMLSVRCCFCGGLFALRAPDKLGRAQCLGAASLAARWGRLICHVDPMHATWCANEQRRQQYGNRAIRAITWSSNLGTVTTLSSTHFICWAQLKFVAPAATKTQDTVASQRVLECSLLSQCVAAEVAVRSPDVCASTATLAMAGRHAASPGRQALHRLREQVVTAVWVKRGVGCPHGTRLPACLPDFINDACGRSAG